MIVRNGTLPHTVFALATFQSFPVGSPFISSHFQSIDRLENWLPGSFSGRPFLANSAADYYLFTEVRPDDSLERIFEASFSVNANDGPILDLKVATVARGVARLCATFCHFPRLCFATLRDFIKIIANDRKTSIHMTSLFFVPRPFATFRDLSQLFRPWSATLAATMRRSGPG
jgi:hypothetical protein